MVPKSVFILRLVQECQKSSALQPPQNFAARCFAEIHLIVDNLKLIR